MTESNDIVFTSGRAAPVIEEPALSTSTAPSIELERELSAASSIPDSLTIVPSRSRASSMIGNLISLDIGEVFTKSELICDVAELDALSDEINLTARKEKLRAGVKASLKHAKNQTNGEYTSETHHLITPLGRLYIQVLVTRIS